MRTRFLSVVALIVIVSVQAATTSTRTVSSSSAVSVTIDGVACGVVQNWEGGDARAAVVAVGGAKHLANLTYDPLRLELPLPPPPPVVIWINDLCANRTTRKTVQVTEYDQAGAPKHSIVAIGALLTEVRFPVFDASVGGRTTVVLVIAVEQVDPAAAPAQSSAGAGGAGSTDSAHFQLRIDGLNAAMASRIEPIHVTLPVSTEAVGAQRDYAKTTGTTQFSNLTFTIADSAAAGLRAWFDNFAIKGNNSDAEEKNASIDLIDLTGKSALFGLQFSHAGIMRMTRLPATGDTMARDQMEIYFEGLTVGSPAASSSSSSSLAQSGQAAQTANEEVASASGPAGRDGLATQETTTALTGSTGVSRTAALADRPIADRTATLSPAAATAIGPVSTTEPPARSTDAVTSSNTTSPADQGTRDPVDFPRVSGLTRLSYAGTFTKDYTNESATYITTEDVYKLMQRITEAASAAGWEQLNLSESGAGPNGRSVGAEWNKGLTRAQVGCSDRREGGTTVNLTVFKQKPPAN